MRYGFIPQALIGTVISVFDSFFSKKDFEILMTLILFVALLLETNFFGGLIEKSDTGKQLEKFSLIYILSPCFLTTFCDKIGLFGKLDVPVLIIYLLCCLAMVKKYYALIPALALAGVLTHQQFVFEYFPMLMILMLYEIFVEKRTRCFKWLLLTLGVCSLAGFYIQFISKINIPIEILVSETQKRTDLEITGSSYLWEYYKNSATIFKEVTTITVNGESIIDLIYAVFLSLPVVLYLKGIFKSVFLDSENRVEKLLILLIPVSASLVIITLAVAMDWGRYVLAYFNAVFFLIFTFVRMGNKKIIKGIVQVNQKIEHCLGSHWMVLMVIYFAICGIGRYGAGNFYWELNPIFNSAFRSLANLIN